MKKFNAQVPSEHYFKNYDSLPRFVSYFYQTSLVLKEIPNSVLEIGIGNKSISNYLKQAGCNVTTCDFDIDLEPDVAADVREMPFRDNEFDLVIACEVLEHLPFDDFEKSLSELLRVSKKTVIISIPYSCAFMETVLNVSSPLFRRIYSFSIKIPYFFSSVVFGKNSREHYWEMGSSGYSQRKIKSAIKKRCKIRKMFSPKLNPHHYFFILEK